MDRCRDFETIISMDLVRMLAELVTNKLAEEAPFVVYCGYQITRTSMGFVLVSVEVN